MNTSHCYAEQNTFPAFKTNQNKPFNSWFYCNPEKNIIFFLTHLTFIRKYANSLALFSVKINNLFSCALDMLVLEINISSCQTKLQGVHFF